MPPVESPPQPAQAATQTDRAGATAVPPPNPISGADGKPLTAETAGKPASSAPPSGDVDPDDFFSQNLEKLSGKPAVPPEPAKKEPAAKVATPEEQQPEGEEAGEQTPTKPEEGEQQQQQQQPADGKKKKMSPWKLVDQYKSKVKELEEQIAGVKTGSLTEAEKKQYLTRIEELESKKKEYEDEILFANYLKHPEWIEKYQQPYERAIEVATADLKEIPLTDPNTGQSRMANLQDLLTLVNMPLGQAQKLAEEAFGNLANNVMSHRNEVKRLINAQNAKQKEIRETGLQRERERLEMTQKQQQEITESLSKTYQEANKTALESSAYSALFKPVEGDAEINESLQKGYALVDKAFREQPFEQGISEDERARRVRQQVAMRHRAGSWGRVHRELTRAQAKAAALEKELAQYKGSTPSTAGGRATTQAPAGAPPSGDADPLNFLEANLQKYSGGRR